MAAPIILLDAYVSINSVAYPSTNVAIAMARETQPYSEMGEDWRGNNAGLMDWTMEMECNTDDAAFFTLFSAGDPVPVAVRADAGVISATNPEWQGEAILVDYQPIAGAHGENNGVSLSFVGSGPLIRDVTP